MSPFLSIVIPAFNEEHRLPKTLERIAVYLAEQSYSAEVIVVDDGSSDGTARLAEGFAAQHSGFSVLRCEHRGKGHAVKVGMLAARGTYRFLCDADLSMPIEQIERFLPPVLDGCDVAIGSREAHGARRYDEPGYRHLMGRVFNSIVKLLAVPGLEDTQCGFKGFKGSAATSIFSRQTMDGFGFDVEALFIARKLGCRIIEVGIDWYFAANSRVQPIHDTIQMVEDVLKVRWNDLRGVYDG